MRLRDRIVATVCALLLYQVAVAADPAEMGAAPTEQAIEQAVEKLKADPNLATERTTRTLRWKSNSDADEPTKPGSMPGWLKWIAEFFSWLGHNARVLVWVGLALLIALIVVWILRTVRGSGERLGARGATFAPTHVRDLDIRPESLPDDIGSTALQLWERGEHRAALSLLYRGFLSRIAHSYSVPIRQSSTEGECRVLAMQHLPERTHEYVALLIRIWQNAIYGGSTPSDASVRQLCTQFAGALDKGVSAPVQGAT